MIRAIAGDIIGSVYEHHPIKTKYFPLFGPLDIAFATEKEVLYQAKKTAETSHNHPEGVKGVQTTVLAVFLAWTVRDKEDIGQ